MTLLEALLEQKKHSSVIYYEEDYGHAETEFPTGKKVWYQDQLTSDKWLVRYLKPIPFEEAWKLMVDGKILQDDYGQLWKIKVLQSHFVELHSLIGAGGNIPQPKIWVRVELTDQLPRFVRVIQPGEVV